MKLKSLLLGLIFSLILSSIAIYLFNQNKYEFLLISLFFLIVMLTSNYILNRVLKKSQNLFIRTYMALVTIRLLIYLVAIVILFILFEEKFLIATLFGINFILYTVIEVLSYLNAGSRRIENSNENKQESIKI